MPDNLGPPSEFGGKVQRNGVQPPPHVPTPSERLSLLYRTGDESGLSDVDKDGNVFAGLLPENVQTQIRRDEGALDKGQEWERLRTMGAEAVREIKDTQGPIA